MYNFKKIIGIISIFTVIMFMGNGHIVAFSETTTGELEMKKIEGNIENSDDRNAPKEGSVELEGVIGDWDPNEGVSKKINDLNGSAIGGKKPGEGEYFTIAATVPLSMDFGVYRSSTNVVMGNFYSPNYKIINHGSKALDVRVGFDKGTSKDNQTTLFIDKPSIGNGKVEIDLGLSYIQNKEEIKVDLTKDLKSKDSRIYLGTLVANEEAIVTFKSNNWEPISWEPEVTESVNFSGTLVFEFSY